MDHPRSRFSLQRHREPLDYVHLRNLSKPVRALQDRFRFFRGIFQFLQWYRLVLVNFREERLLFCRRRLRLRQRHRQMRVGSEPLKL